MSPVVSVKISFLTPITFKKPRFKFTDSKLNHKSHHTVTPHLLRGPSRQRLDFIGCDQMDPATSAGGQCGGVYWFYLEFVDLSHNSLSVIGVVYNLFQASLQLNRNDSFRRHSRRI